MISFGDPDKFIKKKREIIINNEEIEKAKKGDIKFIKILGCKYRGQKNIDMAIFYFLMGVEKDDVGSMVQLAKCFKQKLKLYNVSIKYYEVAINRGHSIKLCVYDLIECYYKTNNSQKLDKYLDFVIVNGDGKLIYRIANLLYTNKNNRAFEFFELAFRKGNCKSLQKLISLCIKNDDIGKAVKYCLFGIDNNIEYCKTQFDYLKCDNYIIIDLCDIEPKNSFIENEIKKIITTSYKEQYFYNEYNRNNISECPICLEIAKVITLPCGHVICTICIRKCFNEPCCICRNVCE